VKNGVPYDAALKMSEARRIAFAVTFGQMDSGKRWNWMRGVWEEVPK